MLLIKSYHSVTYQPGGDNEDPGLSGLYISASGELFVSQVGAKTYPLYSDLFLFTHRPHK